MKIATIRILATFIMLIIAWKAFPQRHAPWELAIGIRPYDFDKIPFNVIGKYHLKSGFGFRLGIGSKYFRDIKPVNELLIPNYGNHENNYRATYVVYRYDLNQKEFNLSGFTGIQYQYNLKKLSIFILSDIEYSYTALSKINKDMGDFILKNVWEENEYYIESKIGEKAKTRSFKFRGGIGFDFELLHDLFISLESTSNYTLSNYYKYDEYFYSWKKRSMPDKPNIGNGTYGLTYDQTGSNFRVNLVNILGISYRF